jgi:hypothetical protein
MRLAMHAAPPRSSTSPRHAIVATLAVGLALAGLLTPVFSKIAIPVMTGALLTFLALPKEAGPFARFSRLLLLIVAPVMLFGLLRFTITEAAPGIVEGGRRALSGRAVAKLRVLVFSQDVAREQATWDPDADGIGSALTLRELVGADPVRGKTPLPGGAALQLGHLQGAIALADGYAFRVWLPARDGGWTDDPTRVDDEAAERRFLAYAWPIDNGHGERTTVFIDEHERILLHEGRSWLGAAHGPPPTAALDGDGWTPWKDKKPRTSLPGID